MDNGILIIAHAPLASALRQGVAHVFPEASASVLALDVQAQDAPELSLAKARDLCRPLQDGSVLILTDLLGATPCNVALELTKDWQSGQARLVAGVNMPMLLRAMTYRGEALPNMLQKVLAAGAQCIVEVPADGPPAKSKGGT